MLEIKIIKATDVNDSHFNSWKLLIENCVTKNPVYEKWLLLPALKYLANDNVYVIFVYKNSNLVCIWPVSFTKKKLRLNTVKSWVHDHAFLGNPIMDKHDDISILEFLVKETLRYFKADAVSFNLYPCYSDTYQLHSNKLIDVKRELYSRPYLINNHTIEEHLTKYTSKSRKKYRRQLKRITECVLNTVSQIKTTH